MARRGYRARKEARPAKSKPRSAPRPIFELHPLEQRILLLATPTGVIASLPTQSFPPAIASVHPMSSVNLQWSDSENPDHFNILKSTDGMNFGQVAQVGGGTRAYTVTGLDSGTPYFFEVEAADTLGGTADSDPASIATAANETEYVNDFSTNTDGITGAGRIQEYAYPTNYLLGKLRNDTATLTLHNVPYHTRVDLAFYFYVIDDWAGGDVTMTVNGISYGSILPSPGSLTWFGTEVDNDQSIPGGGTCPPSNAGDSRYFDAPSVNERSSGDLIITFNGSGISDMIPPEATGSAVAGWGIDDLQVFLSAPMKPWPRCTCNIGGPESMADDAEGGDPVGNDSMSSLDNGSQSGPTDVAPSSGAVTIDQTDLSSDNMDGFSQSWQWTSNTVLNSSGGTGAQSVNVRQPFLTQESSSTIGITTGGNDSL